MTISRTGTLAATAAVIAAALIAWAVGNSTSGDATSSSAAAARFPQGPQGRQAPPGGGRRGFGTPATGATANKVGKAALAKYPGKLEGVMALPDGSFVAHVFTSNGELHVVVSKDFKVLGVRQGGPPRGAGPQGGAPSANGAPSGRSVQ